MQFCRSTFFLIACTIAASSAAAQDAALRLQPASAWSLEYADQYCALKRSFGEEQHRTFLEIRQSYPTTDFTIYIASVALALGSLEPRTRFEPDTESTEVQFAYTLLQDTTPIGARFHESMATASVRSEATRRGASGEPPVVPSDAMRDDRESEIMAYSVEGVFSEDVSLLVGEMHNPMQALRSCIDDLVRGLGVDPAVQANLSVPPKPRNHRRFFEVLEQEGLLGRGSVSSVDIRLVVDESGEVADCFLPETSIDAGPLCTALQGVDFEPGRDSEGTAVRAIFDSVLSRVRRTTLNSR